VPAACSFAINLTDTFRLAATAHPRRLDFQNVDQLKACLWYSLQVARSSLIASTKELLWYYSRPSDTVALLDNHNSIFSSSSTACYYL
jgi:hypothetical protein